MNAHAISKIITWLIACVWLLNGIYAKVLGFVPRHEMIAARVLGETYSRELIVAIGLAEVCMAAWVVSRIYPRVCAATQVAAVVMMNVLEFFLARDLLMWGGLNAMFASIFCAIVIGNELLHARANKRGASKES